ncbi:VOC family protein [Streptomyces sp. HNM0574]|uniref:VOC family protein n=1 Tax=Streptomyces sp. HNM0574 TaxID=2714954 RepID=UPI00146E39BC|nr:VOC family protein [Streptomyces sp. HNM0574]NLU68535.1 VOC family protein [Streptomyces sp. HNM0574]
MHGRLSLTVYYCEDLEAMASFYRDKLGMKTVAEKEDEVVLDGNGHGILLQSRATKGAETIFTGVDVDAAYEDLAALNPSRLEGEESRGFVVRDPEGNTVCFVND